VSDRVEMVACVLRAPGALATETVTLSAPSTNEVRVRIAAAGVCHSDLHLAEGRLGEGRWPIVLGHEGAGVVDAVGDAVEHIAVGDRVVLTMVAPCGQCDPCRRGERTLCEPAGRRSLAGTMADGTTRLTASDGVALQHGFGVACFAQYAVLDARAVVKIPNQLPLWQASLLGCGSLTAFGAVNHTAQVKIGDSVCVVGCGGVGLQLIAAARLAGAAQIIAVDMRADKLDDAKKRGATHGVLSAGPNPAAEIRSLSGGGVDHAFEAVGSPATMRLAWDALRAGGGAVVVGLAPVGIEVRLPAIEFLSQKRIIGSYYGSADPALSLRALVELALADRLAPGEIVSHLIALQDIPQAFERMRRGEGRRSVVVIDPELAGLPEAAAVSHPASGHGEVGRWEQRR
jgi:Zn-dependent alcohol dehydrogenase